MVRRQLGRFATRNSALASGTTRSRRPATTCTGRLDRGEEPGELRELVGVGCARSASTRRTGRRRRSRGSPRGSRTTSRSPRSCRARRRRWRAGRSTDTGRGRARRPTPRAAPSAGWGRPPRRCRAPGSRRPPAGRRRRTARRASRCPARRGAAGPASLCSMNSHQELAHGAGGQEVVAALGPTEAREVDGDHAAALREGGPDRREREHALGPRTRHQDRLRRRPAALGAADPRPPDGAEPDLRRHGPGRDRRDVAVLGPVAGCGKPGRRAPASRSTRPSLTPPHPAETGTICWPPSMS